MTHHEQSEKARVATPCTAASITFGGRCLNCGWDPIVEGEVPDWAQARADEGLCAFVDDWCITHGGPNSLGHYALHHPNPNLD